MKRKLPLASQEHEDNLLAIREVILSHSKDKIAAIILFGSFARGDWVYDIYNEEGITYEYASDYDLLILTEQVKHGTGMAALRLQRELNKKLKSFKRPYKSHTPSIIVESLYVVNKELEKGQYFFSDIKKEGICLYNSQEFELKAAKKLTNAQRIAIAKEDFAQFFTSAGEFLIDCNHAFNRESYKKSAFYLHQATESLLNCTLLVLTGYRAKIHDLGELLALCASQKKEFSYIFPEHNNSLKNNIKPYRTIPQKQIDLLYNSNNKADWFELLKLAYIESRYSKYYRIRKEQLEYLISKVEQLQKITKQVCEKQI